MLLWREMALLESSVWSVRVYGRLLRNRRHLPESSFCVCISHLPVFRFRWLSKKDSTFLSIFFVFFSLLFTLSTMLRFFFLRVRERKKKGTDIR